MQIAFKFKLTKFLLVGRQKVFKKKKRHFNELSSDHHIDGKRDYIFRFSVFGCNFKPNRSYVCQFFNVYLTIFIETCTSLF